MNGNLQLTRKPGQSVYIGSNVTVTVARIRGRNVVLSINAPKEIPVDREEIALAKLNGEPRPE